jgi:hypothetical protein
MSRADDRTKLCGAILGLIDQARTETGDETLGLTIEQAVLDLQFRELETDILDNPGAIEPWLLRRRRAD